MSNGSSLSTCQSQPGSQCPVPGAWCLVPGAWCLVPGPWCLATVGAWCLVPGVRSPVCLAHQVVSVWRPVPSSRCLVPGAWCLVPGAWCLATVGAWCLVPVGAWCLVPGFWRPGPGDLITWAFCALYLCVTSAGGDRGGCGPQSCWQVINLRVKSSVKSFSSSPSQVSSHP